MRPSHKFLSTESRARTWLLGFLLVAGVVAVYFPVHQHPFCNLDDYFYIVDNAHVHGDLNWSTVRWAFTCVTMVNWIPLTWLSHSLDCQFFGLSPAGPHDVNVVLHAVNALLLFWVLKRATGYTGRSFMVAALFALHPINVETVAWIAERKNLLSMFFFLLTLGAYCWYARQPRESRDWTVRVLFALGLMAKSQIITLPFVLLLWDYWPLQRMFPPAQTSSSPAATPVFPAKSLSWLVKEKVPLLVLAMADALITVYVQSSARVKYMPPVSMRLGNAVLSYAKYVGKVFWPVNLAPEYPYPRAIGPWQVAGALLLLLAITALVISYRRYRYLLVGWLWFLGMLVPTIGLIQVGQQAMADRYAYHSFLGLFIMICWGVSDWVGQHHISTAWLAGASAVVLLTLTALSYHQVGYWKDGFTLWSHALQVAPDHWAAEDSVASELLLQGKSDEAMAHYMRAATLRPDDGMSNYNIALYEQHHGNSQDAITHYQHALNDYSLPEPLQETIWHNLGVAYRAVGNFARARESFEAAQKLKASSTSQ